MAPTCRSATARRASRATGTVFVNSIDRFIFPFQTGEVDEEDGCQS